MADCEQLTREILAWNGALREGCIVGHPSSELLELEGTAALAAIERVLRDEVAPMIQAGKCPKFGPRGLSTVMAVYVRVASQHAPQRAIDFLQSVGGHMRAEAARFICYPETKPVFDAVLRRKLLALLESGDSEERDVARWMVEQRHV